MTDDEAAEDRDQVAPLQPGRARVADIKARYGTGSAMIAAYGFAIEHILFGREQEDIAVRAEAPGQPLNPDVDGIDAADVRIEPQARQAPILPARARHRRRPPSV